jgi:hypothetical protein
VTSRATRDPAEKRDEVQPGQQHGQQNSDSPSLSALVAACATEGTTTPRARREIINHFFMTGLVVVKAAPEWRGNMSSP